MIDVSGAYSRWEEGRGYCASLSVRLVAAIAQQIFTRVMRLLVAVVH